MKSKTTYMAIIALISMIAFVVPGVSANYTADYTITDMDDIAIDLIGTGLAEGKSQVPTIVQILVLVMVFALLAAAFGVMISIPLTILYGIGKMIHASKMGTKTRI